MLRKIAIILFSILRLISLIPFPLINSFSILLDENTYYNFFEKTNFYTKVKETFVRIIAQTVEEKNLSISKEKLIKNLNEEIQESILKEEINKFVLGCLNYLKGKGEVPKFSIYKMKNGLKEAFWKTVKEEGNISEEYKGLFFAAVEREIPDEIDFGVKGALDSIKKYVSTFNLVWIADVGVILVFCVVLAALNGFDFKKVAKNLGIVFLIAGVIGVLIFSVFNSAKSAFFERAMAGIPESNFVFPVVVGLFDAYLLAVFYMSVFLSVLGVAGIIISFA
ncbi:MAG: hypothetical protein QXI58_05925 [Candidatus Micrarchaeia archaeon]